MEHEAPKKKSVSGQLADARKCEKKWTPGWESHFTGTQSGRNVEIPQVFHLKITLCSVIYIRNLLKHTARQHGHMGRAQDPIKS